MNVEAADHNSVNKEIVAVVVVVVDHIPLVDQEVAFEVAVDRVEVHFHMNLVKDRSSAVLTCQKRLPVFLQLDLELVLDPLASDVGVDQVVVVPMVKVVEVQEIVVVAIAVVVAVALAEVVLVEAFHKVMDLVGHPSEEFYLPSNR